MAPRGPQLAPRWPQEAPSWPQDGLKMDPRWPRDGPREPKDGGKMPQDTYLGPKYLDVIKKHMFFRRFSPLAAPKMATEGSQKAPSWPQGGPKMGSRCPPAGPKMALRRPKMAPQWVQDACRGTCKHHLHPSFSAHRLKSPPEAHLVALGPQLGRSWKPPGTQNVDFP